MVIECFWMCVCVCVFGCLGECVCVCVRVLGECACVFVSVCLCVCVWAHALRLPVCSISAQSQRGLAGRGGVPSVSVAEMCDVAKTPIWASSCAAATATESTWKQSRERNINHSNWSLPGHASASHQQNNTLALEVAEHRQGIGLQLNNTSVTQLHRSLYTHN